MPRALNIGFWSLIAILIAFNIFRFYKKDWNYADPIDYRGLFLGSQMMEAKENLYNDSVAAEIWLAHKKAENFESNSDFGDRWVSIMVYPPQAFTLPFLLSKRSWKQARIAWWFVCFLSFISIALLLLKLTNDPKTLWLLLAFKGSFFALALGNPVLLVVAFLFLSIYFKDTKPILAGLFLAFAMMKFNLAIPIGLWFLYQKNFKLLFTAGVCSILLLLPSLLIYDTVIPDYLSKVGSYYQMIYEINERNIYTFSNSELTIMLNYYFPQDIGVWKNINAIGQLLGYVVVAILFFRKKISLNACLLALLLVSFIFSYHLVYDALIFILPIALMESNRHKITAMAFFIALSLPINSALPGFTLLHFHYPLLLVGAFVLFIFTAIKPKLEH